VLFAIAELLVNCRDRQTATELQRRGGPEQHPRDLLATSCVCLETPLRSSFGAKLDVTLAAFFLVGPARSGRSFSPADGVKERPDRVRPGLARQ